MDSRQVTRARARANAVKVKLPEGVGRERVSINVIAKGQSARKRPKYEPKHPVGLRHAWQRKTAAQIALRGVLS